MKINTKVDLVRVVRFAPFVTYLHSTFMLYGSIDLSEFTLELSALYPITNVAETWHGEAGAFMLHESAGITSRVS